MNKPETAEHYFDKYDTKERFISYWHQINEILISKPKNVLEIGIGNSFVSEYLKKQGIKITTLDIVKELHPNIVGSVLSMSCEDSSFETVICCEVLEHLPYNDFPKALSEMRRVSTKYVVLSFPDHTPIYRFNIELPLFGEIKKLIAHPFPRLVPHVFDGVHHWVIGKTQYPLRRIKLDIRKAGFEIEKSYRVFEFYGHRFFILKKI